MQWKIEEKDRGITVKDFIQKYLRLSSKMLKYVKYRERGILVNGESVTVRKLLSTGDLLFLDLLDRESAENLEPVDLPIDILYEDEDLVVPSKPANMPTHPSCDHWNDTVANALAFRYQKMGVPFVFRPINRLDRDTSGLLLVARNKLSAGILTESMKNGEIQKTYFAVLEGTGLAKSGVIEVPLHRTAQSVILREVCAPDAPDAEWAKTEYQVLAESENATLVKAHPITGRTHQLRVHFAYLGHPMIGDFLYGKESEKMPRQALHAGLLAFYHPKTHQKLQITAPFPKDFSILLKEQFSQLPQEIKALLFRERQETEKSDGAK